MYIEESKVKELREQESSRFKYSVTSSRDPQTCAPELRVAAQLRLLRGKWAKRANERETSVT